MKRDHLLSNRLYDVLKFMALVALPAFATLYFSLGEIWGLPHVKEVVRTIVAIELFIGALIKLGDASYNRSGGKFDGNLKIREEGSDREIFMLELNEDPDYTIEGKDELRFKVDRVRETQKRLMGSPKKGSRRKHGV